MPICVWIGSIPYPTPVMICFQDTFSLLFHAEGTPKRVKVLASKKLKISPQENLRMDKNSVNWSKKEAWNEGKDDEQFMFQRQDGQNQYDQFELFSPFIQPFDRRLDQSFTPLISPAITPQVNFQHLSLSQAALHNSNFNFSPLNSPAIDPVDKYEEFQQQQRLPSASTNDSSTGFISPPASYQMNGMNTQQSIPTPLALNPVTPALLMQLSQHAAEQKYEVDNTKFIPNNESQTNKKTGKRRFVSMKPSGFTDGEIQTVNHDQSIQNTGKKSFYDQTMDGFQNSPYGMPGGMQVRKTSHKEAEQKRRDVLKNCFKIVKNVLPPMKEKAPSKVQILKEAREVILDYRHNAEYDQKELEMMKAHISYLNDIISQSGQTPPEAPKLARLDRIRVEIDEDMLDDLANRNI